MKVFISFGFLLLCGFVALSQPTTDRGWYQSKDIENIDIGWINMIQFKEPAKPFAKNGWTYSAKQIEFCRNMVSWSQQTYHPKGMLGEMKVSVYAADLPQPITSSSYSSNEAEKNNRNALPNTYGSFAKMYMHLKKTDTKKFWPIDGLADTYDWSIMANNIQLITSQIISLSSTEEYWFTQPRYTIGMKGEYDKAWLPDYANYRNFTNSPNLKKYDHYLIPANTVDFSKQTYYVIIMTKDGKPLPFEQVTVGELLNRIEAQLPMMYKIAINNGTKMANLQQDAQRGLGLLKKKFSTRLNELAYITTAITQFNIVDLANMDERSTANWLATQPITEGTYTSANFPLLRLKKGVKAALQTGDPQWIVFRLAKGGNPENAGEIHLMETFVSRFNYDYVYDYFFGKDKVITPYKPLSFTSEEEKINSLAALPLSDVAKKMAADQSVLYYEDFSAVPLGAAPKGWNTERSNASGESVKVTEVSGVKGKWLKLKRTAYPTTIKSPVTGDFTISFDVLVQKGDVPWGTPGMQLEMYNAGKEKYRFGIDVSPGNMNQQDAAGWVMISRNMPEGYMDCTVASYYSIPSFTGSKLLNQVNMSIRRKGETLTVFCNDQKVYECNKGVPSGMAFNEFHFYVNEKNVYHISNILIRKG